MASRTRRPPLSICLVSILPCLIHGILASAPLVDFDRMGSVGLAGAFAGLDLFDNNSTSVSFDPSSATILSRSFDGALAALGSTNSGGTITAGCALGGTYYFAGSFSSIANVAASNVASYTPSSGQFASLGSGGPNGQVHALFCDSTQNQLWAGGHFTSPASSVAVWSPSSSSWSPPPFGGLSGAAAEVSSITANASQSSLFFGGSFLVSYGGSPVNSTNNPNVPYSSGATPFSSSLVPVPLQNAQVEASPSSINSQFDNIQAILCPAGPDGPGNTWDAQDGSTAVITVRTFSVLGAGGLRLGNTFLDGRGTTAFSLTTIPDNNVQTLTYIDPQTGANETCSNSCPLSTDASILYQDFLFPGALEITGFQLTLLGWQGASSGLHILQLLSSGAFSFAIAADDTVSCYAPGPSNVSFTGTWTEKSSDTNIPGTVQDVLVSTVSVGSSSASGPTFTWMPYVSASGLYDIFLVVPGCTNFEDCPLRTSVKVTTFPGEGMDPSVTTISQQNTEDASMLIYSGIVVPSSPDFVTTITMALADSPAGDGQNGQYELVADAVQLVLNSANVTGGSGGTVGTTGSQESFGFFEWPLKSTSSVNATGVLHNTTETNLDAVGVSLLSGLGGASALTSSVVSVSAVVQHSSGTIFIAGQFDLTSGVASGASNIVAFANGALSTLADNGLNGAVTSLALDGDVLFVGGAFSDTASASTGGALANVAMYNVQQSQWSSLQAGLNGAISSLDFSNGQVLVAGNFTTILAAPDSTEGQSVSGFAAWNVTDSIWVSTGGFLIGSMTFVGNGTNNGDQAQFVAGDVTASLQYGATGFVMLQNGADGLPEVTTLSVQLGDEVSASNATTSTTRRRSQHAHRSAGAWFHKVNVMGIFRRQTSTTLAPLPSPPPATAPTVLAGSFWTNSSSSREMIILGGNFSAPVSGVGLQSLAIYDSESGSIAPLQGTQLNGTVRSLLVQGDSLFIGGEFSLPGTSVSGFAVYDLAAQQWSVSGFDPLQASSGSNVVVRSVTASESQSDVVYIAGSFAQAGSVACQSLCAFNTGAKQWSALGSGIQGDVASVAYAGTSQDILVAAGSIALADNTAANVAMYSLTNSTWAAVGNGGDLPGPVTAVAVNDLNSSSVFAAGRSSDDSSAFLYFWDGQTWASVGSGLSADTDVLQMTMVPLQNTHTDNAVIESDRVLLVSGMLSDSSFGNASSALFDGQSFIPFIATSLSSGSPGFVSGLFYSIASFSFSQAHYLATGIVILISIAIAAGIVFLLALIGILWTLFSRRDEKLNKFDAVEMDQDDDSTHRPSSLLAHINAATRTTILGAASPFAEKEGEGAATTTSEHDPFGPDASNYVRAETPSDAMGGIMGAEETSRPAHARYSFDGTGEGELPLVTGQDIEVLDDGDAAWWYARDTRTGREGVVPAAYVY